MAADLAPTTQPIEVGAIDVLRDVMQREEGFVKVYAAEALLELGLPEGVHNVLIAQEREHREAPTYRLGLWRTLARAMVGTPEHGRWIGSVRDVALDPAAPDRIVAIESLAKLKYVLKPDERPVIKALAAADDDGIALFSTWLLFQTPGTENPQDRVARYLDSKDPISRLRSIYILRFLPDLSPDNRAKMKAAARAEPRDTLTYAYAASSSFIVARMYGDGDEAERARGELHRVLKAGEPAAKREACRALGEEGSHEDLDVIVPLLRDPAPAARVGAALAVEEIVRRPDSPPRRSIRRNESRENSYSGRSPSAAPRR